MEKHTNLRYEISSIRKPKILNFQAILFLIAAGISIGFFMVVSTYTIYLGV